MFSLPQFPQATPYFAYNAAVESANDKFSQIRDLVFDIPYRWMFINLPTQRIFKEWDELIHNGNDDE